MNFNQSVMQTLIAAPLGEYHDYNDVPEFVLINGRQELNNQIVSDTPIVKKMEEIMLKSEQQYFNGLSKVKTEEVESLDLVKTEESEDSEIKFIFDQNSIAQESIDIKLENSEVLSQEEPDIFKCNYCRYKTVKMSLLNMHQSCYHPNRKAAETTVCTQCLQSVSTFELDVHVQSHEAVKKEIFKCSECDFETDSNVYLNSHLQFHKNVKEEELHRCAQCNFKSLSEAYLNKHYDSEHGVKAVLPQEEPVIFKCNYCRYYTVKISLLNMHLRCYHPNRKAAEMTVRPQSVSKFDSDVHELHQHNEAKEDGILKCKDCDFQTKRQNYMKVHMALHEESEDLKWHKCPKCDYKTYKKSDIKKHFLTHKKKNTRKTYKRVILKDCTEVR